MTAAEQLTWLQGEIDAGRITPQNCAGFGIPTGRFYTICAQLTATSSVTGAYVNRGNINASTNPNYPSAVNGDTYIITVAGNVGGASGKSVEVGDMVIAKADNAGGTEASVGSSWIVVQGNVAFTAAGLALATAADAAAQRTALGLGTIATQAADAVAITGGTITVLTGLAIRSTGAAFDLTFASSEVLTAGRTLSFNVGNANRTLTIPATGTAALLGTAQTFSAAQTISTGANSSSLLRINASDATARVQMGTHFSSTTYGAVYLGNITPSASNYTLIADGTTTYLNSSNTIYFTIADSTYCFLNSNALNFPAGKYITWANDSHITRGSAAGTFVAGVPAASGWVNQIFAAAGAIVGTTTNGSPTNTLTIAGSVSTGTGTGGNIILGVYGTNGVSGTAIGTLNTVLTIVAARKVLNISSIPTSSAGLSSGDVWSNLGVLTIV